MESKVRKIGVLTSGGDAQGMNAAVRAVVRRALNMGIEVVGIHRGYAGLLNGELEPMTPESVADIIARGGTFLRSARCKEMVELEYQIKAAEKCRENGIDGLVVIGGDGSFMGAYKLSLQGINVVGIPGTIDRDIACTEYTIGFDTAVNVAYDAICCLRDTANSHERCSIVEVMGRNCGEIAIWSGIATGADYIMIPEDPESHDVQNVINAVLENRKRGKRHNIIIVAEGVGGSQELAKKIEAATGVESRATILGHVQRGGRPTALDVKHASMFGAYAVELLAAGKDKRVVAYKKGEYVDYDITEALAMKKEPSINIWKTNLNISTY